MPRRGHRHELRRHGYPITLGRIEGHGRCGKALTADYVLEYRNTKLAVNEAKAWHEELTEGVVQAKNDAGKLAVRYADATNGQGIYQIDMSPVGRVTPCAPSECPVNRYPTPDDIRKKGKVPKNGSIFFTIFQTFMSGPVKDGKRAENFGDASTREKYGLKQRAVHVHHARSRRVASGIRQLAERYATPLPQLTGEVATLASRVAGHLQKMGFKP